MGEILGTAVLYGIAGLIGIGLAAIIGTSIESLSPTVITENVIGNKTPDKFYYIEGKRVYLEIDGNSVEEYFRNKK